MSDAAAMRAALDLYLLPSHLRLQRRAPIPGDVHELLLVATGDEATTRSMAQTLERSPDTLQRAARFFIEEILLDPQSNSYRVFGLEPDAPQDELRRNMYLLAKLLHPDYGLHPLSQHYAARINLAWNDLKTPDRRAEYDERNKKDGYSEAGFMASHGGSRSRQKAGSTHGPHHLRQPNVKTRFVDWLRRRAFGRS
ncbi:MAG: DnaJ domain-containing protein [Hyphomicrobium sp.]|nr:DnaJ domain-containing protein [Hyphomicrobium sp.]